MKYNEIFYKFVRYVGGNQNLIESIERINGNPNGFIAKVTDEIERFGFSEDTAANELRCELLGYLLSCENDEIGFEIGKKMFSHMIFWNGKAYGEIWCFLIGKGLQHLKMKFGNDGEGQK